MKTADFFSIQPQEHPQLFERSEMVWDVLKTVKQYLKDVISPNVRPLRTAGELIQKTVVLQGGEVISDGFQIQDTAATKGKLIITRNGERLLGASLIRAGAVFEDEAIQIGQGVLVEAGALLRGPTVIGDNSEIRQGAYLRGGCLVMANCVVGHATEMKDSVMLSGAKAGHFAYVGNSILGHEVNLGAGTKLANLKMVARGIKITFQGVVYETGLNKFGAIMNDKVETGCNSVTNPGTILDKNCLVYPNTCVRAAYYPPHSRIMLSPRSLIIK